MGIRHSDFLFILLSAVLGGSSSAGAQEPCRQLAEYQVAFRYTDSSFNRIDFIKAMRPKLSFPQGGGVSAKSINKLGNGNRVLLIFCLSAENMKSKTAKLQLGFRAYDVTIFDSGDGNVARWDVTDDSVPDWAFVRSVAVRANATGAVGISISVANTQALDFGLSAKVSLQWVGEYQCGGPAPFPPRPYVLGLHDGDFTLERIEAGFEVPQSLIVTKSALAKLSGDYCSNQGVTLAFDVNDLPVDSDRNGQEFLILLNLAKDASELFEDDRMKLSSWSAEFHNQRLVGTRFGKD